MSLEWDVTTIGELCSNVSSGGTPKSTNEEYYGGDIPWLNTKEINFNRIYDTEKHITNEGFVNSAAKWVKKDSVIVAMYGATAGKVAMNMVDLTTNQACCNLTIDKSLANPKFVYYYLYGNYERLLNLASGAAQQNLNSNIIKEFPINIPSLNAQNEVVNLLSTIDDKIELNQKINKNLFNIASSLQTDWMINFTPFKSKEFKSSSFGLIPGDWNVGKLGDVIELLDSKRIPLSGQKRENMEKIYPYYGAASLMDYVDDYIFDGIYLLMGEDGTVIDEKGFPILQYVWGKFWVNNHAHILKGKNGFNVDSLYLLLSKTNIQSIVTGAVQAKVNQSNLKSIEIIIPPVEVMNEFNELIKPFFDAIRSNRDEIEKLKKLRDTLLPKLMSGEIDVSKINCDLENSTGGGKI